MHLKEAKGILSPGKGMNISRGCTHGCIYCDSRSACYRMDHDFEDVEVKINAPRLLEQKLASLRKKRMIGTGAMSDPYVPIRENLDTLRACLEIIERYGFGLAIQTKSKLIRGDIDLLASINRRAKCVAAMTLTTFDEGLCRIIEPAVCGTAERAAVLKALGDRGIPTVVWLCPILPFINDTEENIRGILDYCVEAGVYGIICFGMGLTLREGNREFFYQNLDRHFPGLRRVYERKFGNAYIITSDRQEKLMGILNETCARHGIRSNPEELFAYLQTLDTPPAAGQRELFGA
jgi:DNA repair photolyase